MAGDEALQDVREAEVRIDVVEPAAADEGGEDGPVLPAAIGAGEERVLATQGDRTDGALDRVGVGLEMTVLEEEDKAAPELQGVADRLGEPGFAGQTRELRLEPWAQLLEDWPGPLLPTGAAAVGRQPAEFGLDGVDGGMRRSASSAIGAWPASAIS